MWLVTQPRKARHDPTPRSDVNFRQLWTSAASTRTHGLRARCAYPPLVLHPRADAEECAAALTCFCLFICTTLGFAGASIPGAVFIAPMQADAHLHENKSRTEACLRLPSDCRTRMAFMVPAVVVTQATVLCNAEPTLFECGPSRTACPAACAWH